MTLLGFVSEEEIKVLKEYLNSQTFNEEFEALHEAGYKATSAINTLLKMKLTELRDGARMCQ